MQLLKYYGRTLRGTLAHVRRDLGEQALILETRTLKPDSPAARINPGALYEICAVREARAATFAPPPNSNRITDSGMSSNLLEDLGFLRSQIRELLDDASPEDQLRQARLDLKDYRNLIERGIDPRVLAPHFRAWLHWRTASPALRRYLGQTPGSPAGQMRTDRLNEWFWHVWSARLALDGSSASSALVSQRVVGLLGATGVGKTTTLAKISSKLRQEGRQNIAILTLDTHRFGALEQVRRLAKLIGVTLQEVVTQEDLTRSMNAWDRFDWIGIDTPGGMTPNSEAGSLYGSILARLEEVQSLLILPLAQQEADGRVQMQRGRAFGAKRLLFGKMDEASQTGPMVNLTMNGEWTIDSVTTGQRVPQDWEAVNATWLWDRVLKPQTAADGSGARA